MKKFLFAITISLIAHSSFAQSACPAQQREILQTKNEINAIQIPDITYTVNEYNCSQVTPTLYAISLIEPKLAHLLSLHQDYYQSCDRSVDVVYAMEDIKINIILMRTLKEMAQSLAIECGQN